MERRARRLKGFTLAATDGDIGHVEDLYFDDQDWAIRYAVVNTGHWLPGRKVLISPIAFAGLDWERSRLAVRLTRDQVRASPDIDTHQPVSRRQEIEFARHYGYPLYWDGAGLWGLGAYPGMLAELPPAPERRQAAEAGVSEEDSHLRSMREVMGYHIRARDGEIGHVEDFVVDDQSWAITGLVVDTRNWWPGRTVVVPAGAIASVDWLSAEVVVTLSREDIKRGEVSKPASPGAGAGDPT